MATKVQQLHSWQVVLVKGAAVPIIAMCRLQRPACLAPRHHRVVLRQICIVRQHTCLAKQ